MMEKCPPLDERKGIDSPWDELILSFKALNDKLQRDIVEGLWPEIVQVLEKVQKIDIKGPEEEEAWFHLRRVGDYNPKQYPMKEAAVRIEILRIKREFVPRNILGKLRNLPERDPEKYGNIVCTGWWPVNLADRDNSFFSFLQKLSVLRYNGMVHAEFLARPQDIQKAYQVMMDPSKPWYEPLAPWFDIMKSSNMEDEYAHWFGIILSGWP